MLVVADVSPFIALAQIAKLEILPALFQEIVIPPEVLTELRAPNMPQRIHPFADSLPSWLVVRAPSAYAAIPGLHIGETAAIQLARELNADMLLIDEIKGRKAAVRRGLRITGTVGILESAALAGMLDLREAFAQLKQTNFWVSRRLLEDVLRQYDQKPTQ